MSREFRLGLFVVAALLVFGAGVFLIGNREMLFQSNYRLNATFKNVAGLSNGAEVRVGGLQQGAVKRIIPPTQPDGSFVVQMNIDNATRDVVKKDSVASIASEGLVGDKYVEISFGSKDAPRVNNGDTITGEAPLEMSDLLKKTNGILDSAKGAVESIGETADNLRSISSKINEGKGTVGALINDKTVYNKAAATATELQEDMEALKHNFLLRGFFKNRGYEDSAQLKQYEIARLPAERSSKTFVYDASGIFDNVDAAKLKHEKPLNDAGNFLEENKFGLAVVAAHSGSKGDSEKDRVLTEAQSLVVREYLVQNFKLDDTRLKTIGLGKDPDDDRARVEILVYPVGASTKAQK